jgi:hypothetical protein
LAYGRRLFDLAPEPKKFVPLPLGEHENLDLHGAQAAAREFLDRAIIAGRPRASGGP